MNLTLPARQPFSLHSVVFSHGWIQLAPFSQDDQGDGFTYLDRLSSGRVVELHLGEAPNGVTVQVDAPLAPAERDEVSRKLSWMLNLNQDFSAFYALVRQEPKLAQAEARAQGRVLRSPTLFEDVVKTILTTNTVWGSTKRMVQALVANLGDPLESDPARHAFPTPERIAAQDDSTLRSVIRLGYRSPYVLELGRSVASGAFDLEALKTGDLPTPELRKRLLSIKGVGNYASANLLMILGRHDFIPIDTWALKIVSHEWYDDQPIGPPQVEAAFERWGEWKGLAFWFWDWSYMHQ
jgi:3-methyladenine DNA glycosylase/8-oxoguanine DNA glycosylase